MPRAPDGLRDAYAALDAAESYADWVEAAEAHDRLTGAWDWRNDDESVHYEAALLREAVGRLNELRQAEQGRALAQAVSESLYRHRDDIAAPQLYDVALSGTKHLIGRYLDAIEAALRWLSAHDIPGMPPPMRRAAFARGWKVYGRSALLLSGGATLGFHHLGVVKALFTEGVLPHILSGSSTGAMIAAGVCTRDDAELAQMFEDTDQIRLDGLLPVGPVKAWRNSAWLDPAQLDAVLQHNVGPKTFAEAHAHSGRALNITVSPTRHRQKPRLLSHLTAPGVLVARAALASSALPGLFPPVVLEARGPDGEVRPWLPTERWVDGSIAEDLPKLRMARLHNVNHFIVSQTNPHVLPFVQHHGQRGVRASVAGFTAAAARAQGAFTVDLARRITRPSTGLAGQLTERAHALVSQEYRGDIDIHPKVDLRLLRKVVSNPSREDLTMFIAQGERATWPKLTMIRDQTRLGRLLRELVRTETSRVRGDGGT